MKNFIHIAILIASISCTQVKHPTAGTYTSLGGDMQGFSSNASGFGFSNNTNSSAFNATIKQIRVMWQSYLIAEGIKYITDHYYDHEGVQISADKEIKLEELRNAKSLAEGEQALEALKLTPVP